MNVNNNTITSDTSNYKNVGVLRQSNPKEGFKTVLDGHQYRSKGSTNGNERTQYNKEQTLGKTNIENSDKAIDENKSVEAQKLDNSYGDGDLKQKIINFVEVAVDALKQNTEKPSKELVSGDTTDEEAQIQQVLQSLSLVFQNVEEIPATNNGENELNLVNLEIVTDEEKLSPEIKNIIKNNLSEIVKLLEKSKVDQNTPDKILDVLQKLTSQVQDSKGDLSLLKEVSEKPTVESKTTKDLSSSTDNSKLVDEIISFVESANKELKQDTLESSEKSVVNDKSTQEVVQIQQLLKSLSLMIQSSYERTVTPSLENEINSINIEELVGVEKLTPMAKTILKNNLSEIVDLLKKSKANNSAQAKIPEVLQKLTSQVQEVKGDLDLLKIVNENPSIQGKATYELNNSYDNSKLEQKIINFLEVANKSLNQNTNEKSAGLPQENEINPINLEKLLGVEKLSPEVKVTLKNNLNEIVSLVKQLDSNKDASAKVIDVLQKLTTEVKVLKGELNLLKTLGFRGVIENSEEKSIKDNILTVVKSQITKTTSEISPITQMQSLSDSTQDNKFTGNRSFEEKFLNNLLSDNKDESKISKAVNFMNQFETIKTIETPTVITPDNLVVSKNNFEVDVIKTIKFMEINSIKDLTVKMNPKELGEITIKLTMESGIMKASISVQNKETFNLLNQNIQDISDRLKNMDIKIQSLDINIYEDSTFFSKDSGNRNNNGRHSNNVENNIGIEEEEIPVINNYVIEENQVNKFV